jgi:hypothetical protein
MTSDFKDLLRILCDNQVEFMVVGGHAVMLYTEPRYTKDLGILVSRTAENTGRTIGALREFGAPLANLTKEDLQQEGIFYQIGVAPIRIDIITSIPGVDFEDAWQRRFVSQIDEIPVPFISRDDLIAAKLASGRPQDLVDAGALAKSKR